MLPSSFSVDIVRYDKDDTFAVEVLDKFQSDDIGEIIRNDEYLIMIGRKLYKKSIKKLNKFMETQKSVMNDMRLLARLLKAFNDEAGGEHMYAFDDIFHRSHFSILEKAIENITNTDGKLKHIVKHALKYLLLASAEYLCIYHQCRENDTRSDQIEKCVRLIKFNDENNFGDVCHVCNKFRQTGRV